MIASYKEAKIRGRSRQGVGLGLRWDFLEEVLRGPQLEVAFWEVSPENYMRRGGYFPDALEKLGERYKFVCHGLSMSVGACDAPEAEYLQGLRDEIGRMNSPWHSDHLCLSTAGPLVLHELLPLPQNRRTAQRVADRIRWVEDQLGLPFAVENVSYYARPEAPEMSELDFICEVLRRSDAGLLLDVNNVYVNAQNYGYDAAEFIAQLPHEQVVQVHIAGHVALGPDHPAAGLLLDTHGAPVIPQVQELLASTLQLVGPVPVLLERDNAIPDLTELLAEVRSLQSIYNQACPTPGDPQTP
jgi:uncharacterized protein (UPF0276 family)